MYKICRWDKTNYKHLTCLCVDKKRSELVMDVEDEVDLVLPTPPRPTPRENRKKEKKTTTSTFIDDDGFVCKDTFAYICKNIYNYLDKT